MKGWGQQNCFVPEWEPGLSQATGPRMVVRHGFSCFWPQEGHRDWCCVGLGLRALGRPLNSFIHIPLSPQLDSHQCHQPLLGAVEREKESNMVFAFL